MTKENNLLIKCRRWFQKTYGNTYHSVEIVDVTTGKQVAYEPYSYGYDNQCLQTASDMLKELGIEMSYIEICKSNMYMIVDVNRKRDL